MSRAHLENLTGAALGLLGVIAAPLMAADDWAARNIPLTLLDVLVWGAGAGVLYLYGVRGTGAGRW